METILNVEGMACAHCVKSITDTVGAIDGVESVNVNLESKSVTIVHNELANVGKIKEEIEDIGYDVV